MRTSQRTVRKLCPGGVSAHATRVERLLQHLGQLVQSQGCMLGQPGSIRHV